MFSITWMTPESKRVQLARIETVEHAAGANVNLRVTCKECGRLRIVPAPPLAGLARLRRWPTDFIRLSGKSRCSTCGGRAVKLEVTEDAVDGPGIGPTNEREWQVLARQLRD